MAIRNRLDLATCKEEDYNLTFCLFTPKGSDYTEEWSWPHFNSGLSLFCFSNPDIINDNIRERTTCQRNVGLCSCYGKSRNISGGRLLFEIILVSNMKPHFISHRSHLKAGPHHGYRLCTCSIRRYMVLFIAGLPNCLL